MGQEVGSLSHALARTVAPDGHLYTFEFHEQRAKIARWLGVLLAQGHCCFNCVDLLLYSEEFACHGLSDVVTLTCRDVCTNGFGLEGVADAGGWGLRINRTNVS